MKKHTYQLVILGAGSGGLSMVEQAHSLGFTNIALIEKTDRIGGECLYTGCVPSKALLHAAQTGHKNPWKHVRKSIKVIEKRSDNTERIRGLGIDVFHGGGEFIDKKTFTLVNGEVVRGKYFLIASGSVASVPSIKGLDSVNYRTNETIFDLTETPASISIIGGGPIGCEMATAFAALGSKVTLLQRGDRLLDRENKQASAIVQKSLEKMGVKVVLTEDSYGVKQKGDKKVISFDASVRKDVTSDELLIAIGRKPTTNLNLEAAGVEYDKTGIIIDDKLRTSRKHIFAVGDCTPSPKFTHLAGFQSSIALQNMLIPFFNKSADHLVPTPAITYTTPEVGSFGRPLDSCDFKAGEQVLSRSLVETDRAITDEGSDGYVQIMVDKKGMLQGGSIVASNASELLSPLLTLYYHDRSILDMGTVVIPYPTLATILSSFAGDIAAQKAKNLPGWKVFTRHWRR